MSSSLVGQWCHKVKPHPLHPLTKDSSKGHYNCKYGKISSNSRLEFTVNVNHCLSLSNNIMSSCRIIPHNTFHYSSCKMGILHVQDLLFAYPHRGAKSKEHLHIFKRQKLHIWFSDYLSHFQGPWSARTVQKPAKLLYFGN